MPTAHWTTEQAKQWYERQPWLVGCNFIPSTAINQLEMWQPDTFDLATIDRELGWAAGLGFNSVRVFLHDLAWRADAAGFKGRIAAYLDAAERHGIRTLFVFFDDCWNQDPQPGKQPEPRPGVHNSGWMQSPGSRRVLAHDWACLEDYIKDIVASFAGDARVLMWDLYNEPGNNGLGENSLPLLQAAFDWARAAGPLQPLTSGIWSDYEALTECQLAASDIITFHHYEDVSSLRCRIQCLRIFGRPMICTEYMARSRGSLFFTHLPLFKQERVGCYSWGLVSGKTQTIYPWDSPEGTPEPTQWFHDVFRQDGQPFDVAEAELIRRLTGCS